MAEPCEHMTGRDPAAPRGAGCQPCLDVGDPWVHLRVCTTCGRVRCCDSSKNRHASAHAHDSGHPVVRSFEPGEAWWWCYPDQRFVASRPGWPPARDVTADEG